MGEIAKIAGLLVFSTLKFFFSPSASMLAGYGFFEAMLISIIGGYFGFVLFFFAGKAIVRGRYRIFKKKEKPLFSKRNRLIVKTKSKYGLIGVAVLTPLILSIPVGALLAAYYFPRAQKTLPIFFACIVIWALILTSGWSLIVL